MVHVFNVKYGYALFVFRVQSTSREKKYITYIYFTTESI